MRRYLNEYWPYLLALLPVLFLRDFSPASELRYVSLATELLRTGHQFCLTWQGDNYFDTMPLYVWLIALLKVVFGHHYMVTIALFYSFIPSMAILAIMNRWVERFDTQSFRLIDGSQSRMLASIMLFTCGLQLPLSFFVSPDMLFSLWIVLSFYTFWRLISDEASYGPSPDIKVRHRLQWHMGIYVFLAIFTRGSLAFPIIFLCTTGYLLCSGRIRLWTRAWNWRTWLVPTVLCSLWTYLTYREGGWYWINEMLVQTPIGYFLHPESHNRPWFYYLVSIWADTLPWGPVCLVVLVISLIRRVHHGVFRWKKPFGSALQNFYVFSFVLMLLIFSTQKSKLDVKMLPAYPYLIYAGVMQFGQWRWPVRWNWPIIWICRGVLILVFIGGCMCPWLNINTGCYGRVCYRVNRLHRELHTQNTYTYKLTRAAGMDAYLHEDPIEATTQDIADGKLHNTLLIMKERRLNRLHQKLDELGVPRDRQGTVIDELGAYVILKF